MAEDRVSASPFLLKFPSFHFPNFCAHGNWGRSDVNFSDTGIAWTRKPPIWCNIRCSISCISRVLTNFVFENHQ